MRSRGKTILITGGAGFIGSHLAEKLLKAGKEVFVIDDLSTGRIENIAHLLKERKFHFKKGDILTSRELGKLIQASDEIYHLAAAVGVRRVIENPLQSFIVNVKGTERVLSLAQRYKKKVLIASSSEVYGKNEKTPFREEDNRVYGSVYNDRWGYGLAKTFDEFLALCLWRQYHFPVVVVRFFNIIGPRQTGRYGMVVPNFIKQALKEEDIIVFGDGKQTRCFLDVEDALEAVTSLMKHSKSFGEIFNVGSPREISINELAQRIKRLCKSSSKIVHIPYQNVYGPYFEDMRRRKPNISKIRNLIGWSPKITLIECLKNIITYEKKNL